MALYTIFSVIFGHFVPQKVEARVPQLEFSPLSTVTNWVRVRVQFALIKVVDLRTRGSRKKWKSSGFKMARGLPISSRNSGVCCILDWIVCCVLIRVLGFHVQVLVHYHRDICIDAKRRLFCLNLTLSLYIYDDDDDVKVSL